MKRKIFSILFALVLILSFSLVTAVPAMSNDVASSAMHFEGSLTPQGGAVFTGTIPMTKGTYYALGGPGELAYNGPNPGANQGGFDVYAKKGATAYVEGMDPDNWTIGSDHDAYSQAGPWGTWYDPDCADWDQFSLELTEDHWYLRYTLTGESPMSGELTWYGNDTAYAAETDPGTVRNDDGSNPTDPLNRDATRYANGSAQEWGWHCGWGEERIPLQYPGFWVVVTSASSDYHVTLTPAGAGSTTLTIEVPDIVAISVSPTNIDFGTLYPGDTSAVHEIDVDNIGTHEVNVDVEVDGTALFEDYLEMHDSNPSWTTSGLSNIWDDMVSNLAMDASDKVWTRLPVPPNYPPLGEETATLIFTAAASP